MELRKLHDPSHRVLGVSEVVLEVGACTTRDHSHRVLVLGVVLGVDARTIHDHLFSIGDQIHHV